MSARNMLMITTLRNMAFLDKTGTPTMSYTISFFLQKNWKITILMHFKPQKCFDDKVDCVYPRIIRLGFLEKLCNIKKIGFFIRIIPWIVQQLFFILRGIPIIYGKKVDLIYSWDIDSSLSAFVLSRIFKIPWIARYMGIMDTYEKKDKIIWKLRMWRRFLAYKLASKYASLIVVTNDGTHGKEMFEFFGTESNRILFLKNGVDFNRFRIYSDREVKKWRKELGVYDKKVILMVSRLVKSKRVDIGINAMTEVIKRINDVVLIIVGDGDQINYLKDLVKNLGLQNYVRFEGSISHEVLYKYYAVADLFMSFYETSNVGNPLIEALSSGKIVLTLNNGDTGKVIKNNVNGIMIDTIDPKHIAAKIIEILTEPRKMQSIMKNAYESSRKMFWSWDERLSYEMCKILEVLESTKRN